MSPPQYQSRSRQSSQWAEVDPMQTVLVRHRYKASALKEPLSGLARRVLPTDRRKNRPSEISSRFHQLICASSLKFVSGAITPEHTNTAHSNRTGTGNIISSVPDHQAVGGQNIVLRQNMSEQFRLMI